MGGRSSVQYYGYSAIEGKPETENYEKDNLPVRYSISDDRYIDYTYDSLNRLTGKTLTLASPLSYSYAYKTSKLGSGYTTSLIGRENIGDRFYRYTYDELGNITNILSGTLSDSDSQSSYRKYTYDALNQLVREDNETTGETYAYIYDDYGNITQKKVYTRTFEDLEGKKPKKEINYEYEADPNAGWKKLLTEYDGEAIDYDEIGNPVSYRGATLDWNERQLKSYDKGNTSVSYKYDSDGLRASKTVNGEKTTYQYVSGKLMYEDRNGTDIYYYYDSNGVPTSIKYYEPDGTNYRFYLATNQLGDVIGLYNTSGNLVVKYEYDAWGNIIAETNATGGALNSLSQKWSDINPFRYRGYYYDAETGLYYLNSRYYDSETGRFINADDASVINATPNALTDKNLFLYCDNNPIVRVDNGGYFWGTITGAVIGAISGGVKAAIKGENVLAGVGIGALSGAISGLAVDLSIATGGLAGVAIAAAGGALSSVTEDVLTNKANGYEHNLGDIAFNATVSAAFNVLAFGMSFDEGVKTGAKTVKQAFGNMKENFVHSAVGNSSGRIPKSRNAKVRNLGRNFSTEVFSSVIFDNTKKFFGEAFKFVFGVK